MVHHPAFFFFNFPKVLCLTGLFRELARITSDIIEKGFYFVINFTSGGGKMCFGLEFTTTAILFERCFLLGKFLKCLQRFFRMIIGENVDRKVTNILRDWRKLAQINQKMAKFFPDELFSATYLFICCGSLIPSGYIETKSQFTPLDIRYPTSLTGKSLLGKPNSQDVYHQFSYYNTMKKNNKLQPTIFKF